MTIVNQIENLDIQALLGVDIRVHSLFSAISERPDLDLLKTLKGKLHKIILAPETFHPETQITIGKQTDPDELIAVLSFCEQTGALPMVQIILGFPVVICLTNNIIRKFSVIGYPNDCFSY